MIIRSVNLYHIDLEITIGFIFQNVWYWIGFWLTCLFISVPASTIRKVLSMHRSQTGYDEKYVCLCTIEHAAWELWLHFFLSEMTQVFHGGQRSDTSRPQPFSGHRPVVVADDVVADDTARCVFCFCFASTKHPLLAPRPATESRWRPQAHIYWDYGFAVACQSSDRQLRLLKRCDREASTANGKTASARRTYLIAVYPPKKPSSISMKNY